MIDYKSNKILLEEFNAEVYGHESAKKAIINLINKSKIRYLRKYECLDETGGGLSPGKILLIAPSGTGKTYLVEVASKIMHFPLVKLDACALAPSSATGTTPEDVTNMLVAKAKSLVKTKKNYQSIQGVLQQMVVFVDEIDKLAKPSDSSGRWCTHVQESFLTIFENTEQLSGVSFIFAGAFTGIEDYKAHKTVGFTGEDTIIEDQTDWGEQVIKYGLIPELVGRLTGVHKLEDLTKDCHKNILINLLMPKKRTELLNYGCDWFSLTETQIEGIVTKAVDSKQGVRVLKRELDKLVQEIEFNYEEVPSEQLRLGCRKDLYLNQSK